MTDHDIIRQTLKAVAEGEDTKNHTDPLALDYTVQDLQAAVHLVHHHAGRYKHLKAAVARGDSSADPLKECGKDLGLARGTARQIARVLLSDNNHRYMWEQIKIMLESALPNAQRRMRQTRPHLFRDLPF